MTIDITTQLLWLIPALSLLILAIGAIIDFFARREAAILEDTEGRSRPATPLTVGDCILTGFLTLMMVLGAVACFELAVR